MKHRGPVSKVCEVCGNPYSCETRRSESARFCSMRCTREARRTGLIDTGRTTWRGEKLHVWTEAEDALLRTSYLEVGPAMIGERLGLSKSAVTNRARRLGIQGPGKRRWSDREDAWLAAHVTELSYKEMGARLGRSVASVQIRAKVLGLRRLMCIGGLTPISLAGILGVSRETVYRWIVDGRLEAKRPSGDPADGYYSIDPWDVRWFLRENPTAIDVRRVQQEAFIDLVLGDLKVQQEVARFERWMERTG